MHAARSSLDGATIVLLFGTMALLGDPRPARSAVGVALVPGAQSALSLADAVVCLVLAGAA